MSNEELETELVDMYQAEKIAVRARLEETLRTWGIDPEGLLSMKEMMKEEIERLWAMGAEDMAETRKKLKSRREHIYEEYYRLEQEYERLCKSTKTVEKHLGWLIKSDKHKKMKTLKRRLDSDDVREFLYSLIPTSTPLCGSIRRRVVDNFDSQVTVFDHDKTTSNVGPIIGRYYPFWDVYGISNKIIWAIMMDSLQETTMHEKRHRWQMFNLGGGLWQSNMFIEGDAELFVLNYLRQAPKNTLDAVKKYVSLVVQSNLKPSRERSPREGELKYLRYDFSPALMFYLQENGYNENGIKEFYLSALVEFYTPNNNSNFKNILLEKTREACVTKAGP